MFWPKMRKKYNTWLEVYITNFLIINNKTHFRILIYLLLTTQKDFSASAVLPNLLYMRPTFR